MLFSVHGDLFLFCAQRVSVSGVLDHGSDGSMDHCSLRFYICLHVFTGAFGGSFCSANVVLPPMTPFDDSKVVQAEVDLKEEFAV